MKVFISPTFRGVDKGDGGIRRVVEAQHKYLPEVGITIVDNISDADVVALHGGSDENTNKPIVAHCHGMYWNDYKWERWADSLNVDVVKIMNKAVKVTAPSKWVANSIKRGMLIDAIPVYHGVDCDEWTPGENKNYVLWNKTRVDPVCDPTPVNKLAALCKNVNFITTYGQKTSNVNVTGKLAFSSAKQYIRDAGVYLCTSKETFGIGTLEAMACGVPVLGWNWGGQAEFIENGIHGWLVEPDNYDLLKEKLYDIIENRDSYSKACRETAQIYFTWKAAACQYAQIYKDAYKEFHTPVKVTVVIPCYNLGHMVKDAVQSVTEQKFTDYEIIIVDDASTDNSGEIIDSLCTGKVKAIHNTENKYLAGALNTGIEAAEGKYIIPLDADNMLAPNSLEILSNALDNDLTTHVVYGKMDVIESDGKRWTSDWPPEKFNLQKQLNHQNQCPSTSMYRKSIWKRVSGYRTRCRTAEDADFWCRVSSFGGNPKRVTDATTLIYRNRSDSMSHVERDWNWHHWYTWRNKLELLPFAGFVSLDKKYNIPSYDLPKICVVIPVGPGHAKYLPDALDSLVAQTFTNWEVNVVWDSLEPVQLLPAYVNLFYTSKPGSGPAQARNIGIKNSNSELVLFLDADDYLQPTALEDMYNESPGYGYIYCDWIVQESKEVKQTTDYSCTEILTKLPHSVVGLYSKRAIQKIGGFDEKLNAWEDWDLILALNATGNCGKRVAKPLFQYRMNSGSRREELYEKRESGKIEIMNKWGQYIRGEKQLMACSSCGGRSKAKAAPVQQSNALVNNLNSDAVLLEYTKDGAGATTYRGKTGTLYRFGSDYAHRIKYVYKDDVQGLLNLGVFKVVEGTNSEILEASGPPIR